MTEIRGNGYRACRRLAWLLAGALALAPVVAPPLRVRAAEPERIGRPRPIIQARKANNSQQCAA